MTFRNFCKSNYHISDIQINAIAGTSIKDMEKCGDIEGIPLEKCLQIRKDWAEYFTEVTTIKMADLLFSKA